MIKTRSINLPTVVLEVANSHGGDYSELEKTVDAFWGVPYEKLAMKFQVFSAETIALSDFSHFTTYQDLEFSPEQWESIVSKAEKRYRVYLDIFDPYGAEILGRNQSSVTAIKLQASVIENLEVINAIGKLDLSDKEIICNVSGYAASVLPEIVARIEAKLGTLTLQIGFQSYPTRLEDTALVKIAELKKMFPGRPIALADHLDGKETLAKLLPVCMSRDVSVIEKHICIDRETAKFDAISALEPNEVSEMCANIESFSRAFGKEFVSPAEAEYLKKTVQIPLPNSVLPAGSLVSNVRVHYRRTSQGGLSMREIRDLQSQHMVLNKDKLVDQAFDPSDFSTARVGIIVACRMKSSRLRQKALEDIGGIPSIERCLLQCLAAKSADTVILATSDNDEDSVLSNYTLGDRVGFFAGDADDVLRRFVDAAIENDVDVVVRVTGDNPLVSHEWIDRLVERHFKTGADYSCFDDPTLGLGSEVMNVSSMRRILDHFGGAPHSEYMTWYFTNNPDKFVVNRLRVEPNEKREYRLTLDYDEDLLLFRNVFERLGQPTEAVSMTEVYRVLDANPELSKVNLHLTPVYRSNDELITMLDAETKF